MRIRGILFFVISLCAIIGIAVYAYVNVSQSDDRIRSTPGIRIVSPQDGTEVHPGQRIRIRVESVGGAVVNYGNVSSTFFGEEFTSVPFEMYVTVPKDAYGSLPIDAVGGTNPDDYTADTIRVTVKQTGGINSLRISEGYEKYIFETDWNGNPDPEDYDRIVTIYGKFYDGIEREIPKNELHFESDDPSVASVDTEGIIRPHKLGAAIITISRGSISTEVYVYVRKPIGMPRKETVPPIAEITITPPASDTEHILEDKAGWYNSDVTVTITAEDNEGGSGIKNIIYHLTGLGPHAIYVKGDYALISISHEGYSKLSYIAEDNELNESKPVTLWINIDKTPPAIELSVKPDILWPPDHKMVEIVPSINATDNLKRFGEQVKIKLESITSNEPDNAPGGGDGNTTGDILIKPDGKIFLRAERSGTGNGRVYTITYNATDKAGNNSFANATVTVPHERSKGK